MNIVGAFTAGVSCDWATAQVAASARVKERRIGEYAHRVMSRVSLVRLDSDHAVEIATTMLPRKRRGPTGTLRWIPYSARVRMTLSKKQSEVVIDT